MLFGMVTYGRIKLWTVSTG